MWCPSAKTVTCSWLLAGALAPATSLHQSCAFVHKKSVTGPVQVCFGGILGHFPNFPTLQRNLGMANPLPGPAGPAGPPRFVLLRHQQKPSKERLPAMPPRRRSHVHLAQGNKNEILCRTQELSMDAWAAWLPGCLVFLFDPFMSLLLLLETTTASENCEVLR